MFTITKQSRSNLTAIALVAIEAVVAPALFALIITIVPEEPFRGYHLSMFCADLFFVFSSMVFVLDKNAM